eukprot:TRINITY_DN10483_c0_g1_i1.p1 TRINITY_DN10483_c0_g1~~TRINITY_DN10483_c0_g1_i1.p1  ORF type:complete len:257 (-),score=38.26 TRINITY_DN10483_c0_g1_i1:109-879(-)
MNMNSYTVIKKIGEGCASKIYLVQDDISKKYLAAKIYKHDYVQSNYDKIEKEISILKQMRECPRVPTIHAVLEEGGVGFIMDLYETDLFEHRIREEITESNLKHYFMQVLEGIEALHAKGIAHMDLKLENILIDSNNNIVLTDFNSSHIFKGEEDYSRDTVGTLEYLAPEVILQQPYRFAPDYWMLGIMLYDLFTAVLPFEGPDVKSLVENILHDQPIVPHDIPRDARELICELLKKQQHNRLTSPQTIRSHRFFT